MSFDFKHLTKSDNVFMTYNNVIQCVDMFILDFMQKSIMKGSFNLGIFNNSNDNNLIRMLNRKEENIFNLLNSKEIISDQIYFDYLSNFPNKYSEEYITDFIKGFGIYMRTKCSVNKIVIAAKSKVKKDIILNILGDDIDIEFVNDDNETIEKYIQDDSFNVIFTDRSDIVEKNISYINNKVICFPYVSYLFNVIYENDQPVLISKGQWEIKSFNNNFTIGYFEPFKITESMFGVG